jgi:type II secretory pathway pseudopilin PulG
MRRAVTIIELIIAMVILSAVVTMALLTFSYMNSAWNVESDKAAMRLTAKAIFDEISRSIRTTGGELPGGVAGLRVFGRGGERLSFVLNSNGWVDKSVDSSNWNFRNSQLAIPVSNALNFSDNGQILTTLHVPAQGALPNTAPIRDTTVMLPIKYLIVKGGSCSKDSVVADVTSFATRWPWDKAVRVDLSTAVYNLDSLHYYMASDTLMLRKNRGKAAMFAVGVDTLRFQYFHPVVGWRDSLVNTAPANKVTKVRVRIRVRTLDPDVNLRKLQPATKGYYYEILQTEVSMRNDSLVNK